MKQATKEDFQHTVWHHYDAHARALPWRMPESNRQFDSYKILVSEMMLQQTSVARVEPKYNQFLRVFPTLQSLAQANRPDVLRQWSGLGYNRRAVYLHQAAQSLSADVEPWTIERLVACKGIGHNTAAAVCVYAYNQPHVFIETNIRTVYIHHFFSTSVEPVSDAEIGTILEQTMDSENPREFYWALMDYGSYLKSQGDRSARRSAQHSVQAPFIGSRRQLRGQVIRYLTTKGAVATEELAGELKDSRLPDVLQQLERDGLLTHNRGVISL